MTELKEFDLFRVARSDGADTGPGYWPVTAPPTVAKKTTKDAVTAEKLPRTKPQMIRLAEDDPRFVEWKVKLGILLKQELCPTPDEGNPWLVEFPRGYWLYEKSKHLWVSGYPVKARLFKSPQEFAVHLIWLLSSSTDYRDCCCAHCNATATLKGGVGSEDTLIITNEPTKPDKAAVKVTPVPLPNIPGLAQSKPNTPVPPPVSAQPTPTGTDHNSPAPTGSASHPPQLQPKPQIPPIQPQPQLQPQPQPQPQPHPQPQPQPQLQPQQQQQLAPQAQQQPLVQAQPAVQQQSQPQPQPVQWGIKSPLLFRAGELVWYQNGNTWRLGTIAAAANGSYEVMPIGHGLVQQANVTKQDGDMRPFYAFTVPPVSLPELREKPFDAVPWEAMLQASGIDNNRREIVALDASKMAAVKIDHSYSLWSPLSEDPNAKTVTYYGCFSGAERVEIGDSLRLRSLPADLNVPPEKGILGLRFIFTNRDFPGAVFFRGHIYQLVSEDKPNKVRDDQLPVALQAELKWRNSFNGPRWSYILIKENVVFKEQSIRGRFYPTHRLMPILDPNGFQSVVAKGVTEDQYAHLNNRMDGMGVYIGRKMNRLEILGASVPHGARLSLEPFIREESA